MTISTMSACSVARRARSTPMRSTGSSVSRRPAVSDSSAAMPAMRTRSVSTSRVVPGTGVTMARSCSSSAFISDDLPTFGFPANHDARALTQQPRRPGIAAPAQLREDRAHAVRHALRRDLLVDLLREIRARLDQRHQLQQLRRRLAHKARHAALQLPHRRARRRLRVRADQLHHRLRAAQVDPPVQKRPLRELARRRRLRAQLQHPPQRPRRRNLTAVTLDLRHVLPRVRPRRRHPHRQRLVNRRAVPVHHAPVHHPVRRNLRCPAKRAVQYRLRPRAAHPHNRNPPSAPGRRNRRNRTQHVALSFRQGGRCPPWNPPAKGSETLWNPTVAAHYMRCGGKKLFTFLFGANPAGRRQGGAAPCTPAKGAETLWNPTVAAHYMRCGGKKLFTFLFGANPAGRRQGALPPCTPAKGSETLWNPAYAAHYMRCGGKEIICVSTWGKSRREAAGFAVFGCEIGSGQLSWATEGRPRRQAGVGEGT